MCELQKYVERRKTEATRRPSLISSISSSWSKTDVRPSSSSLDGGRWGGCSCLRKLPKYSRQAPTSSPSPNVSALHRCSLDDSRSLNSCASTHSSHNFKPPPTHHQSFCSSVLHPTSNTIPEPQTLHHDYQHQPFPQGLLLLRPQPLHHHHPSLLHL